MVRSKNVHESNGDRSLFSTRSEIERSKHESAYGRERPHLRLPRACLHAGRSRPSSAERGSRQGSKLDHHWISHGSEMDRGHEPSTKSSACNLISEQRPLCTKTSVKTSHQTGVATGPLALLYCFAHSYSFVPTATTWRLDHG